MRVFLDTNVLVSAFATRGLCADVLRTVLTEHELMVSEMVLAELERVLQTRMGVPGPTVQTIITFLRRFPIAPVPADMPQLPIRDPDDRPILAAALGADVDVFITGDRELLALEGQVAMTVTDPRGFWNLLRQGKSRKGKKT